MPMLADCRAACWDGCMSPNSALGRRFCRVQGQPVRPKRTIGAAERTNLWTVCLTSAGVLGYLNRRISPLGALPDQRHRSAGSMLGAARRPCCYCGTHPVWPLMLFQC